MSFRANPRKDDNNVTYKQVWKNHRINSERFEIVNGHVNPIFPVTATCIKLAKVNVGDFVLSKKMLGKLQNYQPCEVNDILLQEISANPRMSRYAKPMCGTFSVANSFNSLRVKKRAVYFPTQAGTDPAIPRIGDLMLFLEYVPCGPVACLNFR